MKFTFDGCGINDAENKYKPRIATLSNSAAVDGVGRAKIGNLLAAAPDVTDILEKILLAHESGNNGAYMGEAVLCDYFAKEARAAINKSKGVRDVLSI